MRISAKILVVDDETLLRLGTARSLRAAGYEVLEAGTGTEGIRLAQEYHPDVVVLDVVLPDIDGLEVSRRIKSDSQCGEPLIMLLSDRFTTSDDQAKGLEHGADGYIVRPVSNRELLARIQTLVRLKRTQDELKQTQEALRKSNNELEQAKTVLEQTAAEWRTTFDAINNSVCLLDADGKILRCNRATTMLLQHPYPDIIGKSCWELLHGTSEHVQECQVCHMQKSHGRETFELQWHDRWFNVTTDPVLSDQVELVGIVHIMTDITEQKQVELALQESEARFRATFEQAAVGIAHVGRDGRFLRVNQRFCDIVGYTKKEVLSRTLLEISHPDDVQSSADAVHQLLTGKTPAFSLEKRYIRKDDSVVWANVTASSVRDTSGAICYAIGVIEDISGRKKAEKEARLYWQRFLVMFENFPEILYIVDPATYEVLLVNKKFQDLLGKDPTGGLCYQEFQGFETVCEFCTNTIILNQKGRPYTWEYHNPLLNRDFLITDQIILWPDGRDVRFELAIDITEKKRIERALKTSHEELGQRVRERTAELSQTNRQLHREIEERKKTEAELRMFNEVMLDREERIIELKEEVNRLSAELGHHLPYEPVWEEEEVE